VSRAFELTAGLLLIGLALVLLAGEFVGRLFGRAAGIGDDFLRWWPILLVGLSLFFLLPALFGRQYRRVRAGMVIPGFLLAGIGSALLYTSLTDRWGAWSHLWTAVPFSFGLGMYAAGWIADAPAFKWIGSGVALGGLVVYLVFATTFVGEPFRVIAAVGLLALGVALTIGGLGQRLSRKSPAA
jgi:hypothetical protein